MKIVRKQDISSSKLDYTAKFMTLKKKFFSLNIFQKYTIMGPPKWFYEKPVRAKIKTKQMGLTDDGNLILRHLTKLTNWSPGGRGEALSQSRNMFL